MKSKNRKGVSYEEAMKEAFGEIFQNLKEIEKNTEKKLRLKTDFERRRGSAPSALVLRDETKVFRKPRETITRQISAPVQPKSFPNTTDMERKLPSPPSPAEIMKLSTMPWL